MGACHSKRSQRSLNFSEINGRSTLQVITSKDNFVFDLVSENANPIRKEYKLNAEVLGKGGYGEVRRALHIATNEIRAIKIIYKHNCTYDEQERIFNEISIMKSLDHPNIVRIYEYFQDEKYIFIVMELVQGGELFEQILEVHHFTEALAAKILFQLLSAVNYLHKHKIVHRDLKPENILFDGHTIKLIDFGTSRTFNPKLKMKEMHGTPYYIAPEVINQSYNEKCDEWSCGVILYILLSGNPPFNGQSDAEITDAVQRGKVHFDLPQFDKISQSAKNLISKLLNLNIKSRISAEAALNEEWFTVSYNREETFLNNNIIANLKTFSIKSKMQEAVYYFIVNNLTTKDEKKEIIDIFKGLDLNNDGVISKEELMIGLKKINYFMSDQDIELLMNKIDNNKNNGIDYTEFVAAAIDREKLLSEDKIKKCFKQFDKDGSGKISVSEFKQVFQGNNIINDDVWKNLIEEVDLNNDGEIEFDEFKKMLTQIK
jgi:calcium-dependent protein kinase